MGHRPVGSAPPTLRSAPPPKYQNENLFEWLERQNRGSRMNDRPGPRQTWESDGDYRRRLDMWDRSVAADYKEKTLDRREPIKGNNPKTQTTK